MRKKVDRSEVFAELLPGAAPEATGELLKDLHLLTRDGDLNADARRKMKQIRHLLQLLAPAIDDVLARHADPIIVDCGAGKSYLGFLLYVTRLAREARGRLVSIESRPELVAATAERAARFGCARMTAVAGTIAEAPLPERVHVVTALHACDTATDDALVRAVRASADWIAVVPCCQAEVARQLGERGPEEPALAALCAHPWHRRELGSHLTNVVRALALEAHGYQVTVTELTGWEHSLKNELILARRVKRYDRAAQARLDELVARFGVTPAIVRGLHSPGNSAATPSAER
ncbi:MAG: SAM-dependent methyltransferase [Deltaproteobacteria bacterium]|nr:SAM-dependent methyltransferase [Kofleriaceae bacterium]